MLTKCRHLVPHREHHLPHPAAARALSQAAHQKPLPALGILSNFYIIIHGAVLCMSHAFYVLFCFKRLKRVLIIDACFCIVCMFIDSQQGFIFIHQFAYTPFHAFDIKLTTLCDK